MTTTLEQRAIPFSFDETTPFLWNPQRPEFTGLTNVFSFLAIGLERFIVSTMREAMPLIRDPDVLEECDAFLKQEARHAKVHVGHTRALIKQNPALQEVLENSGAQWKELEGEPLEYKLAFIADLESTFTPFFKVYLDHPELFFEPGDDRVASLFLWHFLEEVEHRASSLVVYEHVVGNRWYRTRVFPKAMKRASEMTWSVAADLDRLVPLEDRQISIYGCLSTGSSRAFLDRLTRRDSGAVSIFSAVPMKELAKMTYGLLRSQVPGHDPQHQPLPRFGEVWFAAYERGVDVTRWYGSRTKVPRHEVAVPA